jgi:hypothetical protein
MNVFVDFHHPALFYSLFLLFERRLKYKIYRPVGMEWVESGYWKLLDLCETEYQREEKLAELLILDTPLPYTNACWNETLIKKETHTVIKPSGNIPCKQRGITLKQFKDIKFDLVIASFIWNIDPFRKLIEKYQKTAKLLIQVGNAWSLNQFKNDYVIASLKEADCYLDNIVFYKQELDVEIFKEFDKPHKQQISSFVDPVYILKDDSFFIEKLIQELTPSYIINLYGKQSKDGYISNIYQISDIMRESKFGLHLKFEESGYGHVLHNWFAVGRPLIFRSSQHKTGFGKYMLEHMETGIDIDKVGYKKCIEIVKTISNNDYLAMCNGVKSKFKEQVDFNQDAENIKRLLNKLYYSQ